MKKWILYIIISILLIISISSITLLILTNKNAKGYRIESTDRLAEIENNIINEEKQIITTSYSNTKVSPDAIINFNTYYKGCGHTIKEENKAEEDIVNKAEQDITEIYIDWDIKKFSAKNLPFHRPKSNT